MPKVFWSFSCISLLQISLLVRRSPACSCSHPGFFLSSFFVNCTCTVYFKYILQWFPPLSTSTSMAPKQATTPAKPLWGPIVTDPALLSPGTSSVSDSAFGTAGVALLKSTYSKVCCHHDPGRSWDENTSYWRKQYVEARPRDAEKRARGYDKIGHIYGTHTPTQNKHECSKDVNQDIPWYTLTLCYRFTSSISHSTYTSSRQSIVNSGQPLLDFNLSIMLLICKYDTWTRVCRVEASGNVPYIDKGGVVAFAPLLDLTAGDGEADEVGIGGDGFRMDSACIVTEHICNITRIGWSHYQL